MNLLTSEQGAVFDAEMLRWQRHLNLDDWRIERGNSAPVKWMATVDFDYGARLAAYRTGNFGAVEITPRLISEVALHESIHILLYELLYLTRQGGASAEVLESAEHRVTATLEKILIGEIA